MHFVVCIDLTHLPMEEFLQVAWLWYKCEERSQIDLLKKETNLTKEATPQWTFKKTYLVAFLGQTAATETT